MRAIKLQTLLAGLAIGLASTVAGAGSVDVKFVDPDNYADARDQMFRRDEVLQVLAERLKQLGEKRLPASQTLQVEVLDVDLAGDRFPRTATEIRVLRGRADWPRMHLRYTLREGDKVIKSGEDHIADMNYLMNSLRLSQDGPYPYEKRMLDHWFSERFAAATPR